MQKNSQPQRIDGEPLVEILENIIYPRVLANGWYRVQNPMLNRYAELRCNGVEVRIKSLAITH